MCLGSERAYLSFLSIKLEQILEDPFGDETESSVEITNKTFEYLSSPSNGQLKVEQDRCRSCTVCI